MGDGGRAAPGAPAHNMITGVNQAPAEVLLAARRLKVLVPSRARIRHIALSAFTGHST